MRVSTGQPRLAGRMINSSVMQAEAEKVKDECARTNEMSWYPSVICRGRMSRNNNRKSAFFAALLLTAGFAWAADEQLPAEDGIRIREFYRLSAQIQDQIWPEWSNTPAPLLLVTANTEFLTHHPAPPAQFKKIADDLFARPRQFSTNFLATFPAFGPPSVIVVGEPQNTSSKSSTHWLITLMHEHFHQLQNGKPGYFVTVDGLGLSRGDQTGMWMLNYAFPYEKPELGQGFTRLRDLLLETVNETDNDKFKELANQYVQERRKFFALLSSDDHKYLAFQIWQEGIARYTEIKAAEAAAKYKPTPEFAALADFEPFADHARQARAQTFAELKKVGLGTTKRAVFYPFGAAEGLLLDRLNPAWKATYFEHLLSTDALFAKQ